MDINGGGLTHWWFWHFAGNLVSLIRQMDSNGQFVDVERRSWHRLSWCSGKIPRCEGGFAPKSFGWSVDQHFPIETSLWLGIWCHIDAICSNVWTQIHPNPQKIASFIPKKNPNHMGSMNGSPTMNHNGIMGTQYPIHIPIAPFKPDLPHPRFGKEAINSDSTASTTSSDSSDLATGQGPWMVSSSWTNGCLFMFIPPILYYFVSPNLSSNIY